MVEEESEDKPKKEKEEKSKLDDFISEVRKEREALEKVREENKILLEDLKKLRAEEILGGRSEGGFEPAKKKTIADMTPEEAVKEFEAGKLKLFE